MNLATSTRKIVWVLAAALVSATLAVGQTQPPAKDSTKQAPAVSKAPAPAPVKSAPAPTTQAPAKTPAPAKEAPTKSTAPAPAATQTKAPAVKKEAPAKTQAAAPKQTAAPAKKSAGKAPTKSVPAKPAKKSEPKPTVAAAKEGTGSGRRDPFTSLVSGKGGQTDIPQTLPPGIAGLVIGNLTLNGIVKAPNGMIAVVTNPQRRVYFLREGARLYNGQVEKITMDAVSFREQGKDVFGKPVDHQITRKLYPSAGEQP